MPRFGLIALFRFLFRTSRTLWKRQEFRGLLSATVALIVLGAVFFKITEPHQFKTWVDAFYFTVVTLTTVGYGDFTPTRVVTKLFVIGYIFIGLALMGSFLGIVGEAFLSDARRPDGRGRDSGRSS